MVLDDVIDQGGTEMQDYTEGRYTEYLRQNRDGLQRRLDGYQSTGQEWDSSNLSDLRRRLRESQRDLDRYQS
jgi:hypothetical protein